MGSCEISSNKENWACKFDGIFFGINNVSSLIKSSRSDSITFDTGSTANMLDMSLFMFMYETYFIKKDCTIFENIKLKLFYITCNNPEYSNFQPINFKFKDRVIYLMPWDYFMKINNVHVVDFIYTGHQSNLIGDPMLKKMTTIYNRDLSKIEFYSSQMYRIGDDHKTPDEPYKPNIPIPYTFPTILLVILIILGIVIVVVVAFFIIKYIRKRKNADRNAYERV